MDSRSSSATVTKGPASDGNARSPDAHGRPRSTNRLIREASPYLQQHAHNPVDWYPWGSEAFARARATKRPVFLSVGYATCHWCHVMAEETFEDEAIAHLLNERFVSVKVDREERPDVDAVYMAVLQAMTGHGGWPMSLFLTPDREAFFAGTYFPPRAGYRGAKRGFEELLVVIADTYARETDALTKDARQVTEHVRRASPTVAPGGAVDERAIELALGFAAARYDAENGGAEGTPKFPTSFPVRLLLGQADRLGDEAMRGMATTTLARMRDGGVHDVLGGGFHRYAVDARWSIPHFEKLLCDNALLARAYLESGEPSLVDVARTTLDFLLREMRTPKGTFEAGTDADSLGPEGAREEGRYFTFTKDELVRALGDAGATTAAAYFGVTDEGNFEGRSVLSRPRDVDAVARRLGLSREALERSVATLRAELLAARERRPRPKHDESVLVAWNALAVSALARAAIVLGERRYETAALTCARTLVSELEWNGRLAHLHPAKGPSGAGLLDDHAFLADALLDVFELTSDVRWLDDARTLVGLLESHFLDEERGGYFLTPDDGERLIVRDKPAVDGALPSGNAMAAMALVRLAHLTCAPRFERAAERQLRSFAPFVPERLPSLEHFLLALDRSMHPPAEIVVVVPEGEGALVPAARPFLEAAASSLAPRVVCIVASAHALEGPIGERVPWVRGKRLLGSRATAYLCVEGACRMPSHDPAVIAAELAQHRGSTSRVRESHAR